MTSRTSEAGGRIYCVGMTVLLGGTACPLGVSVQFIEATVDEVVAALPATWAATATGAPLPQSLDALLPLEAPWTRLLVASTGAWTALLNNFVSGGDSSAPGPAIARSLGRRLVVAVHAPRHGPGHASTQLEVFGPDGEPPLMYVRSLSATATDGRWEWYESGTPLSFEDTDRYTARLKRDRFDRPMLLRYLGELGVPVSDDSYGPAVLLQHQVDRPTRTVSLAEARADFEQV